MPARGIGVAMGVLCAGLSLPALASAAKITYVAQAYDLESGAPLYREVNVDLWRDGELVSSETTCLSGKKLLLRRSVDYRTGRLTPSSRIDNGVTGASQVVTVQKGGIALEHQRNGAIERATVHPPAEVLTPGSLPLVVVDRWNRVMAGHPIDFAMPVATRLEWYSLRMRKDRFEMVDGRKHLVVILTPQNAALRLIAPRTEFWFDVERRALVEYRGQVSVTNAAGDRLEARVVFAERPRLLPPEAAGVPSP